NPRVFPAHPRPALAEESAGATIAPQIAETPSPARSEYRAANPHFGFSCSPDFIGRPLRAIAFARRLARMNQPGPFKARRWLCIERPVTQLDALLLCRSRRVAAHF